MRAAAASAAAVVCLLGAACGESTPDDASSPGTSPAPVIDTGADATPTTLPQPVVTAPAVSTLDGIGLTLTEVAEVDEPVALAARNGYPHLYVAEKGGRVRQVTVTITKDSDGKVTKVTTKAERTPMLDLAGDVSTDSEQGLLGLAFSSNGRRLYVHYTDRNGHTNVDEYEVDDDEVDTSTRRRLLFVEQPFPNHNGGQLAFGPDGFLYIGLGDGGSGGDPLGNAQNLGSLLGKLLRIDPEGRTGDKAYGIPDGNPLRDGTFGAPEVWAFGLRNPWRFSFDRATGDLWIGDVGQDLIEEIDYLPNQPAGAGRAANLGWPEMEGSRPYEGGTAPVNAVPPLFDYDRSAGQCSVIGGYVYRGAAIPTLQGVYVYADYCVGELRGVLRAPDGTVTEQSLGVSVPAGQILTFGEDNDGALYVLSSAGKVYRIDPA
jgi:glucose/arabinose dehydrogenase